MCEDGIEKSVPHNYHLSSLGKPLMTICDPRDGFLYPTLILMMDHYTPEPYAILKQNLVGDIWGNTEIQKC